MSPPSVCPAASSVLTVPSAGSSRLFLHSVVSALLGVALVLVVSSYVFVEFFLDPSSLRSNQHFLGEWGGAGLLSSPAAEPGSLRRSPR